MSRHSSARPKNIRIALGDDGQPLPARPKQRLRRHPSCLKPGGNAALRQGCTCLTVNVTQQLAGKDADGAYLHSPGCPCRKSGETR